jgi:hypothetical protein
MSFCSRLIFLAARRLRLPCDFDAGFIFIVLKRVVFELHGLPLLNSLTSQLACYKCVDLPDYSLYYLFCRIQSQSLSKIAGRIVKSVPSSGVRALQEKGEI